MDTVINLAVIERIFVISVDISAVVLVSGSHNFKMYRVIVNCSLVIRNNINRGSISKIYVHTMPKLVLVLIGEQHLISNLIKFNSSCWIPWIIGDEKINIVVSTSKTRKQKVRVFPVYFP